MSPPRCCPRPAALLEQEGGGTSIEGLVGWSKALEVLKHHSHLDATSIANEVISKNQTHVDSCIWVKHVPLPNFVVKDDRLRTIAVLISNDIYQTFHLSLRYLVQH